MVANGFINEFLRDGFLNRFGPRWGMRGFGFSPFRMLRSMIGLVIIGIIALFSLPILWKEQGVPQDVINSWILIGWVIFGGAVAIVVVVILGVRSKKKREAAKEAEAKPVPVTTSIPVSVAPSIPERSLFSRMEEKEVTPPVSGPEESASGVKYCIHCGKEILEGTQYCIHCGEKQ